jgi:tetratricopeptide (TPR) repeat protein
MRIRNIARFGLIGMTVALALVATGESSRVADEGQAAVQLEQQGRFADAEAAWQSVLKSNPANAEACAHLGLLAARQEHYQEAVSYYQRALVLNPGFPNLRLNLGLALFKSGDLKQAVVVFQPLLAKLNPDSAEAQQVRILLGMAHYGLTEYGTATPYLKKATARDLQNLELRLVLAHSCLWSKQYQCVLDVYREILLLNPQSAEADMLAGEAQDGLKNRSGAIEQFRAAAKADPRQPEVHFGLGYLLWTQHQYEEAISEFKAELASNPDHVQSQVYLGDALMQMSHPDLAQPILEDVASRAPSIWLAHLDLGIIYADIGKQGDAVAEMERAASLAPGEVNIHWRLGRLYKAMGRSEDAQAEFTKARSLHTAEDQDLLHKMSPAPTSPEKSTGPGSR